MKKTIKSIKSNGITLVSLVVTIIILLIIAGISISQLTRKGLSKKAQLAKEEQSNSEVLENRTLNEYEKNISVMLNDETKKSEYTSNDIEDFTPNIKEINGDYIEVQVDEIKTKNDVQIGGYIWILNGKVKGCTTENKYVFVDLEYNTEYQIQVIAVDENAKFKFSPKISGETLDKVYLYNHGKAFTCLTGGFTKSPRSGSTYSSSFNEDNIYIYCYANAGGGGVHTAKKIDLTKYKYLKVSGNVAGLATSDSSALLLTTTTVNYWGTAWSPAGYTSLGWSGQITGNTIVTDDITTLTGTQYICAGFNQSHGYIYEMWLEK